MKPSTSAVLAALFGFAAAQCNRDNCLRAIAASAFTTRSGTADCSRYLQVTVYPGATTTTTTVTVPTSGVFTSTVTLTSGGGAGPVETSLIVETELASSTATSLVGVTQ
ncbi:hypothetical protein CNYM01_02770, partial [Colletotrichum nymphaeae SA-01]